MAKKNRVRHDAYFKAFMSEPDIARDFIKELFPAQVVRKLDLATLTQRKESFVQGDLKEAFSDVVFRVKTESSDSVFVTILIEHKSYRDNKVAGQMLLYLAQAYHQQLKSNKQVDLILPVLYYHGQKAWTPKRLHDLVKLKDEELRSYIPSWEHLFLDLPRIKDEAIQQFTNNFLTLALFLQKRAAYDRQGLKLLFVQYETLSEGLKNEFFLASFAYLLEKTPETINLEDELNRLLPPHSKKTAMSAYDKLLEKGFFKGRKEGREEGLQKGLQKGLQEKTFQATANMIRKGFEQTVITQILEVDLAYVEGVRKQLGI